MKRNAFFMNLIPYFNEAVYFAEADYYYYISCNNNNIALIIILLLTLRRTLLI